MARVAENEEDDVNKYELVVKEEKRKENEEKSTLMVRFETVETKHKRYRCPS